MTAAIKASKRVLLMILDGYGISPTVKGNAVLNAKTPNLDHLQHAYPSILIGAAGAAVGLPDGQIGNSEVGHLNIGAGRIIYTGLSLINKAIKTGEFQQNVAILAAIKHAQQNHSQFHVMGLYSHGGVHSLLDHILAVFELAHAAHVPTVLHIFGDGRDVPPQSILQNLTETLPVLKKLNVRIGSIAGRYYAMDRDQRWDRIELAYGALFNGSKVTFDDPLKYIQSQYDQKINDEFLIPATNGSEPLKTVTIQDSDAILFANFRPDRARQLAHEIFGSSYYEHQPAQRRKNLFFVTMMQYEGIVPSAIAFPPQTYHNTLGEVLAKNGYTQLRIAETEKYAHVTFFFDGGKEIDYPHEQKLLIPSNKAVATYDLAPAMSCAAITDALLGTLGKFDVTILNFANPDMVGHTGNYEATVKGLEALDAQIGLLLKACAAQKVTVFFTADHGNAEEMLDDYNQPVTKHTTNPVPFVCTDQNVKLKPHGILADVAVTILDYLGIKIPQEMDQPSLIQK